jgi:hypothetical protein
VTVRGQERARPPIPSTVFVGSSELGPIYRRTGSSEIAVPPNGLGQRHTQMIAWLDENCGADGWAITPSGTRGVLNDALSIYFADATLASAFVARWCVGSRVETAGGVFQVSG